MHISLRKLKKKDSLTLPPIPHDRKRRLAQTSRPAPQIALAALRPRRGHKHRGVAVPLVAPQTSRLREEGARAALGPEDAVGAGAALRQGGGGGEGEGEVAGAEVGDCGVDTSVCYTFIHVYQPRRKFARGGGGGVGVESEFSFLDWGCNGLSLGRRAYKTTRHRC